MIIIDVRSKEEYNLEHLNNAINFDLMNMTQGELPNLDKSEKLLLYCVSGARSGRAKKILESAGFTNVENGGGYYDMKSKGY